MPASDRNRQPAQGEPGGVWIAKSDSLWPVLALVAACPEAPKWGDSVWAEFLMGDYATVPRRVLLVAGDGEQLQGMAAASLVGDTSELESVLVRPGHRRCGVGRRLTRAWLQWGRRCGAREALLEVRESNAAARRLYEGLGFVGQGKRRAYYSNPVEDAVLMRVPLVEDAN